MRGPQPENAWPTGKTANLGPPPLPQKEPPPKKPQVPARASRVKVGNRFQGKICGSTCPGVQVILARVRGGVGVLPVQTEASAQDLKPIKRGGDWGDLRFFSCARLPWDASGRLAPRFSTRKNRSISPPLPPIPLSR